MSYPRMATPELLDEIERVCRMRIVAEQIPTDQQLADKRGVSRRLVRDWMLRMRKTIIAGGQPGEAGINAAFHVEQRNTGK